MHLYCILCPNIPSSSIHQSPVQPENSQLAFFKSTNPQIQTAIISEERKTWKLKLLKLIPNGVFKKVVCLLFFFFLNEWSPTPHRSHGFTCQFDGRVLHLYSFEINCHLQILRDLFHYKPPITKEQFFNSGFVERKIIMCTDVLKLVQHKNKSLQPPKKASTTTTSSLGQVVSMRVSIYFELLLDQERQSSYLHKSKCISELLLDHGSPTGTEFCGTEHIHIFSELYLKCFWLSVWVCICTSLCWQPNKTKVTDLTQVRADSQRTRPRSSIGSSQREGGQDPRSVGVSPRSLTDVDQPQVDSFTIATFEKHFFAFRSQSSCIKYIYSYR